MAWSKKIDDSLKNLEDLGIFQLRQLAREIGVHLPTTMRKNELIKSIKEISSGQVRPFVPSTKKGRPAKPLQTSQDIDSGRPYDYLDWGKVITPIVDTPLSLYHMSDNSSFVFDERKYATVKLFDGIVSIDELGNARIHEGTICEIGRKFIARVELPVINKYDLRDGDYVEGKIGESYKDGSFSLFNVSAINGNKLPFDRLNFSQVRAVPACEKIGINKIAITKCITPIGKGQRVLVESKDGIAPKQFMHEFAEEVAKKQKVIYVTLDEQPEDFFSFENKQLEYVLCPFDLPVEKQLYMLELAANRAKRLAEQGEDVALFVEDLFIVARLYARCFKSSYKADASEFVLESLKKLLATGRNLQDGGSVTFVSGITNNREFPTSNDVMFETRKACNSFITLNTGSYFGAYDFDISACHSSNQEKLLNQNELQRAYKIRAQSENKTPVEIAELLEK